MSDLHEERKLPAILFTDVVGLALQAALRDDPHLRVRDYQPEGTGSSRESQRLILDFLADEPQQGANR